MAEAVSIRINGLRAIQQALNELPKKVDRKLLNQGLIAGATLVRDDARDRVPLLQVPDARRRRGTLRRAIRAGRVRPTQYAATVWVRIRQLTRRQVTKYKAKNKGSAKDNPNDPFYWAFVEFGTSTQPARPFMRPAFEAKKQAAVLKSVGLFRERVQAEIAKLGRKQR
jgi:HK97 gp10 family phage protein